MIAYTSAKRLQKEFINEGVFQDYIPDLLNLVRFPLPIFGLQLEDLLNTILGENVVIAFDALIKPQSPASPWLSAEVISSFPFL